ncbi:hypothetical protein CICLE_v10014440mg [Citrus x clementina]|uniref:glucan endo-1,3-beta-D-glucosidase n=1 Tax=Citrus clementina TaxID=85681 RepID=V4UKW6_CITCL|nr:hypothetical protein CICLE_v10014440mg [Citrus x clementina]
MENPKLTLFIIFYLTVLNTAKAADPDKEPFVGVNIGTDVSNLLSPTDLVSFLQVQKITHIRLYDADPDLLKALAKTKIRVIVSVPNNQLLAIGSSNTTAASWIDTYNSNLIKHILDRSGTPFHPEVTSNVYIYELFNEDLRSPPISEANWGLFHANTTPVYLLHVSGSGTFLANDTTNQTYCIAMDAVDTKTLQAALDWACGPGRANCSDIQPGEPCYQPNNVKSHASYAFDSYYHEQGKTSGSCDFKGVAMITTTDPSHGSCIFPGSKKVSNKTKAVVNSTQISGAADRLRFISLRGNQISANAVAFSILTRGSSMSSWACKKCTFLNSPSRKSTCQICLTPSSSFSPPSKSSVSVPTWSCKACTFLNPYNNTSCELCNTRAPVSGLSSFEDLTDPALDSELDSSVGSVFLPLQLKACTDDTTPGPSADNSESGAVSGSLKILSYNVWFREDLEMHPRMKTIGDLIQLHSPDIICFQEITPNIYDILCKSSWWKGYRCSVPNEMADSRGYFCMQLSKLPVKSFTCEPFKNSIMGRELCVAEVEVQEKKPLVVATSHLESPCPGPPTWDQMFSKERVEQAKEAINLLKKNPNVIFCGDMNWDDKLDSKFPLPDGWVDAWTELRPGENGWTYDTKSNKMLSGNRTLQKRLDRFICSLRDFKIVRIDMIGVEAIPGLLYVKEKKVRKEMQKLELPVLPSDHYGLLLTISNNIG